MRAHSEPRGTLLIGPTKQRFVPIGEDVKEHIDVLVAKENLRRKSAEPVIAYDITEHKIFSKETCGPIDLSSEGVDAIAAFDWDEAFARQCQARLNAADADKIANDPAAAG